jgi:3-oxoacyl-[acyl-carrier-protein] synthase III
LSLMTDGKRRAGIAGVGSSIPDTVLTNEYFEKIVETSDEWIVSRTGIKERRKVSDGEAASDVASRAAVSALECAGMAAGDLDLIVCATVTGDMPLPATASIIQDKIGAVKAAAFDIQAGCSGFVYGLACATNFIETGMYDNVLVIGVDLLSTITDYEDRTTCVLFGDGAGAAVLTPAKGDEGILGTVLGSDGSGGTFLKVEAGGSKLPTTVETVEARQHYVRMDGKDVFRFAVKIMGDATVEVLEKCGISAEDVDLFIPHQANIRIIDAAARRLNLPPEKVFVNVQKYGNTSAASIPIAIDEAAREGRLKKGDIVLLVGFGAGLTWAASVIKWGIDL